MVSLRLRHGDHMAKRFTVAKIITRFEERVSSRSPLNLCQQRNADRNYNTTWWRRFKRASKRRTPCHIMKKVSHCNSRATCICSLRFTISLTFKFIHCEYNHTVIKLIALATKLQRIKNCFPYAHTHTYRHRTENVSYTTCSRAYEVNILRDVKILLTRWYMFEKTDGILLQMHVKQELQKVGRSETESAPQHLAQTPSVLNLMDSR